MRRRTQLVSGNFPPKDIAHNFGRIPSIFIDFVLEINGHSLSFAFSLIVLGSQVHVFGVEKRTSHRIVQGFHSSTVPTLAFYDSFHSSIVHTLAFYNSLHSSIVPTLAFCNSFHSSIVPTCDLVHLYLMVELTIEFVIVFCDSTVG